MRNRPFRYLLFLFQFAKLQAQRHHQQEDERRKNTKLQIIAGKTGDKSNQRRAGSAPQIARNRQQRKYRRISRKTHA